MTQATPAASARDSRRPRRILSGVALVLTCITILASTVAIWTQQVALNNERFTQLIDDVTSDPAVIDPIAAEISAQVVAGIGVQGKLQARLPEELTLLAGAFTSLVQDAIDKAVVAALQNPTVHAALVQSISTTHAQIARLLRGDTSAVTLVDGYLTLNVLPVMASALTTLQTQGFIPADTQLPDLSSPEAPEALAEKLETSLGVTLPPGFGTIKLMAAERLTTAQSVVRALDVIVVVLVVLTVVLIALALWLADNRRLMLIYLAIGTSIALVIAWVMIPSIENAVTAGIANGDFAGAMRAVVDATLQDLRNLTVVILIATVIVAIAAFLWGRPKLPPPGETGATTGEPLA